jgi:hypothetical protein
MDPNRLLGRSLTRQMVEQFESDPSKLSRFHKTNVPRQADLRLEGTTDATGLDGIGCRTSATN